MSEIITKKVSLKKVNSFFFLQNDTNLGHLLAGKKIGNRFFFRERKRILPPPPCSNPGKKSYFQRSNSRCIVAKNMRSSLPCWTVWIEKKKSPFIDNKFKSFSRKKGSWFTWAWWCLDSGHSDFEQCFESWYKHKFLRQINWKWKSCWIGCVQKNNFGNWLKIRNEN